MSLSRIALFLAATALSGSALAQTAPDVGSIGGSSIGGDDPAFTGRIGATRNESTPAFAREPQAPANAPNVLLVLLDDAGFATTSAFGGLPRTPSLEKLAAGGLRYNRFHTTAICSPTRAALLSGRNQHQVGFGNLSNVAAGYPAYNAVWKRNTASIARILQGNGYSTAAFGKWHNTPQWEISPAGPFNHWPTGLGFDHFYGFMGGEDNHWEPHLYTDTTPVAAPATPEQGYHLTTDLVDKAVGWVNDHEAVAPSKPYFLYFATGAVHTPHHVGQEWIDRNKGRFDQGWDKYREEIFARERKLGVIPRDAKLTPRPKGIPAWDSLTPDERRLYAHQMEVFSAFVEQTDFEVGRLIDTLRARPGGDNLLVLYVVGDNGGSAEGGLEGSLTNESGRAAPHDAASQLAYYDKFGGPDLANHYSAGWAWANTTPFQWMKQVASHFGGTRNPLVVSWPGHTSASRQVRDQFGHVNDIAPTILDATHIAFPEQVDGVRQLPFEGRSLVPTFTNPRAPERHTEQYFEIFGNRAIYKDGWVAAAKRDYRPWDLLDDLPRIYRDTLESDRWELYDVAHDFSEANDLASANPAKLAELKAEFVKEGQRNGVFPILPLPGSGGVPTLADPARKVFALQPDVGGLPKDALPNLGKAHSITVRITGVANRGTGVLLAEGGRLGGFVLYARDGHLVFENNAYDLQRDRLVSTAELPQGPAQVGYTFVPVPSQAGMTFRPPATAGTVRLTIDGRPAGEIAVRTFPSAITSFGETFDIGQDRNSKVSTEAAARRPFDQPLGETRIELP